MRLKQGCVIVNQDLLSQKMGAYKTIVVLVNIKGSIHVKAVVRIALIALEEGKTNVLYANWDIQW